MTGLSERDTRNAIARARANPAVGAPATPGEAFAAEWTRYGYVDTVEGERESVDRALGEFDERLAGAGVDPSRWRSYLSISERLDRHRDPVTARALAYERMRAELPDDRKALAPTRDEIEARARNIALSAEARVQRIRETTRSFWVDAAMFAASALRANVSLPNVITLPIGAARGAGILRTAAIEARNIAAIEAVQQPAIQERRAELGLEAGFGPAAENVTGAAIGAGLIGGGSKALVAAYRKLFGHAGTGPADLEGAAAVLDRSEQERSGLEDGADLSGHREKLDAVAAAYDEDRPELFPVRPGPETTIPPGADELLGLGTVEMVAVERSRLDVVDPADRARFTRDAARNSVVGIWRNDHTGWEIEVPQAAIGKSIREAQGDPGRLEVILNLGELARAAVRVDSRAGNKANDSAVAAHQFIGLLSIGDQVWRAKLRVRRVPEGTKVRYVLANEVELDAIKKAAEDGAAQDNLRPSGSTRVDIRAALAGVKRDDGSDVLPGALPADLPPVAAASVRRVDLAGGVTGPAEVFVPGGQGRIGVRYALVEARDLVTSHGDDLGRNPKFPRELQPRDRSRQASAAQVAEIRKRLQPGLLLASPTADTGAPIVGPDLIVESGNARTIGLRQALLKDRAGAPATAYRQALVDMGLDIAGLDAPVLVRIRETPLTPELRRVFVKAANERAVAALSPVERALADAAAIDDAMLALHEGGDAGLVRNGRFVRDFIRKAVSPSDVNEISTAGGRLSLAGETRVEAALTAKAFQDRKLLELYYEATDDAGRGLLGALADAAPMWARLRAADNAGRLSAGLDPTAELVAAVRLVIEARRKGQAVGDLVRQLDLFGGEIPLRDLIVRAMFRDPDLKRPLARNAFAERLNRYVEQALVTVGAGDSLFGDALPTVSAGDIWTTLLAGRPPAHGQGRLALAGTAERSADASPRPSSRAPDDRALAAEVERIVRTGAPVSAEPSIHFRESGQSRLFEVPITDDAGAGIGRIGGRVRPRTDGPDRLVIDNAGIDAPEDRGQGHGIRAYDRLAREALASGHVLASDSEVTLDAARIYESLERRGFEVWRNPATEQVVDAGTTKLVVQRGSVFEVTRTPDDSLEVIVADEATGEVRTISARQLLEEAEADERAAAELRACVEGGDVE